MSKAHLYGKAQREIYATLPEGDEQPGMCALLLRSMYGTQDAAKIWQDDYADHLVAKGFTQGISNGAIYANFEDGAISLVRGDDFLTLGDQISLDKFGDDLKERYIIKKTGNLGPEESDDAEAVYLNRVIRLETVAGAR